MIEVGRGVTRQNAGGLALDQETVVDGAYEPGARQRGRDRSPEAWCPPKTRGIYEATGNSVSVLVKIAATFGPMRVVATPMIAKATIANKSAYSIDEAASSSLMKFTIFIR